jgi:heat-inducible transcriptional repressor
MIAELNDRSRSVFSTIVSTYLETGDPMGSRLVARRLAEGISPASVRNVMSDLEDMGLLYSRHTSGGRLPTDLGLRLFVDGLMEVGSLSDDDRITIEEKCAAVGKSTQEALEEATSAISGLAHCTGLVVAPKSDRGLKHIEFVGLGDGRALVVMVADDGSLENRLIELPPGTPPSVLVQAANYLNARLAGRTLDEARTVIQNEIVQKKAQIDALTFKLVEAGLATRVEGQGEGGAGGSLIIKGHARLLDNVNVVSELEHVRMLFDALDRQELIDLLLDLTKGGDGVQIFIGSENELFDLTGCAIVTAPISGLRGEIMGAIGVIGPTRINYSRIIPIVDYTAQVVGRVIG